MMKIKKEQSKSRKQLAKLSKKLLYGVNFILDFQVKQAKLFILNLILRPNILESLRKLSMIIYFK